MTEIRPEATATGSIFGGLPSIIEIPICQRPNTGLQLRRAISIQAEEKDWLRSMLPHRQLQALVGFRVAKVSEADSLERAMKDHKSRSSKQLHFHPTRANGDRRRKTYAVEYSFQVAHFKPRLREEIQRCISAARPRKLNKETRYWRPLQALVRWLG